MNIQKAFRAIAVAALAGLSLLGWVSPAEAAITQTFSLGATCGGATSGQFTTSGPAFQVSLCVSTTAEKLCGNTLKLRSATAPENGAFNITARTNGPNYPDPNNVAAAFPIAITNPPAGTDLGGTNAGVPQAAGANQLLATFTIAPQASAINTTYVLSTSADSIVSVDSGTNDCAGAIDTFIPANLTLTLSSPPAITSGNTTTFTVGTLGTFNVTFTGSPTPTITETGALPGGVNLSAAGVLSGTPTAAGNFPINIKAANGNLPDATQAFTLVVNKGTQTINFAPLASPQAFSPTPFTVAATATSGLAVTFSTSTTPTVCSSTGANGATITMLTTGVCTVTANQVGNANFNAATAVPQSFTINGTAPGAPTIGTGTPGNLQATIAFTPPVNNGGSAIINYTATCNPGAFTNNGAVSPITIGGLTNGTLYTCSVTATNGTGTGPASGTVNVTPSPAPVPPTITSANTTTFTVGTLGTFTFTGTGSPPPTFTVAGALPTGVNFNAGTATISGTPTQAGNFPITVTATGTAPAANQGFTLVVNKSGQTINFTGPGAQAFSATPVALTATATSGLPVTFTVSTTSVCQMASATTVRMISAGLCTVLADQFGNANFNAAPQVPQSFTITAVAPGAPIIAGVTPGNGQLSVAFSPPVSNGGSAIISYTATCNPGAFTATGPMSAIAVVGLANGTPYTCSVIATNGIGPGPASATATGTPQLIGPPIVFTSNGPANAIVGVPFNLAFSSATASVSYTLSTGTTPPGLTLNSTGSLSGTPTTPGTYVFAITASNGGVNQPSTTSFTIIVLPASYQGAWYAGAAENGWGVSLIEHDDRLVAGWYYYGASGASTWVIMPGCTWSVVQTATPVKVACTGALYASRGAAFSNYNPALFTQASVGNVTFTFTEGQPDAGTMVWNVNGVAGTKSMQRLHFGGGTAPSSIDYSDVWWAENGWGMAIFQDRATIAFAWYTYDAGGNPMWMLMNQGSFTSANVYKGTVVRATGSQLVGATYNPALYTPATVGNVTLTFLDANTATFTYTVDGVTQTKTITRMAF